MKEFFLSGTGDRRNNLKSFKRRKRWLYRTPRGERHPRLSKKSNARVANRTDASGFSQPYLGQAGARRLSTSARPQWKLGAVLDLRLCGTACASEDSGTRLVLLLITVSLERMKSSE
jgi:hypothetical protein